MDILSDVISLGSEVGALDAQAKQAETEADFVKQKAKAREARSRAESEQILAAGRTQIAASGFGIEGSPLEVMLENEKQAELEALNIRFAGQAQRAVLKQQAKFLKKQKLMTTIGGSLKIAEDIITQAVMAGIGGGGGAKAAPTFSQSKSGLQTRSGRLPTKQIK